MYIYSKEKSQSLLHTYTHVIKVIFYNVFVTKNLILCLHTLSLLFLWSYFDLKVQTQVETLYKSKKQIKSYPCKIGQTHTML